MKITQLVKPTENTIDALITPVVRLELTGMDLISLKSFLSDPNSSSMFAPHLGRKLDELDLPDFHYYNPSFSMMHLDVGDIFMLGYGKNYQFTHRKKSMTYTVESGFWKITKVTKKTVTASNCVWLSEDPKDWHPNYITDRRQTVRLLQKAQLPPEDHDL